MIRGAGMIFLLGGGGGKNVYIIICLVIAQI